MSSFASATGIRRDVAEIVRPPRRITVSEAAKQHLRIALPGGYYGPWDGELTPYMKEPMDCLSSREYDAVIFVGPARMGKTQALIDCWITYVACCDPGDMTIINTSQDSARDYSKRRADRMIRNSPELAKRMSPYGHDDNVFDKHFRAGNILALGWPSISQLSGKDIRFIGLTDYDRLPENIDGEGDPFMLAQKRTQTFLSGGMTMAESSPGWEVIDPDWKAGSAHEAPPAKGILSLYNQGDRRRLYWQCDGCREWFAEDTDLITVVEKDDLVATSETAVVACPHCGQAHEANRKRELNLRSVWLKDGQTIDRDGVVSGGGRQSRIASFWMTGAAAAFQTWASLKLKRLNAELEYERSGIEEALKSVTNLDDGKPYIYKAALSDGSEQALQARAEEAERYTIPDGVRTLVAAVDVQGGKNRRFVVQVFGFGVGGEQWLIDRYNIARSNRLDSHGKALPIDPAGHIEDWELLTDKVLFSTYKIASRPGYELRVYRMGCDSGGEAGVTERAYEWWRSLRVNNLNHRVLLIKGTKTRSDYRIKRSYPDAEKRKGSAGKGDVPILLVNTNMLKDAVFADLQREEPGPRYVHFPDWLDSTFYKELTAETRTDKGWERIGNRPNEAFDLFVYAKAVWIDIKGDKMNWESPRPFAQGFGTNPEVMTAKSRRQMKERPIVRARRRVRFKF